MLGSDKQYCHRSIQLQYLRIVFVGKSQYFGCVHSANSVRIASLQIHCNLNAALMLQLTTLMDLTGFFLFFLRLTICPVVNFVFLCRHKNLYLLFPPRFSLILFSL